MPLPHGGQPGAPVVAGRSPLQQLFPAETRFRAHLDNLASGDKSKDGRRQRAGSAQHTRQAASLDLDAPTRKALKLGLLLPEEVARMTKHQSAPLPERPRDIEETQCCDGEPRVTFAQHPALAHLSEADAQRLALLLPVVTTASSKSQTSNGEVETNEKHDIAYFEDCTRPGTLRSTSQDVLGVLFKRTTSRTASFGSTSIPQTPFQPTSPLPMLGKGHKSSSSNDRVDDEVRSTILNKVRAARAVFRTRLARGDFDDRTEIAYYRTSNATFDDEIADSRSTVTAGNGPKRLAPLDYARAYFVEAARARREGRKGRLLRPLIQQYHTEGHKAFFAVPKTPDLPVDGFRFPRLPTLRLPADPEAAEAPSTNAGADTTEAADFVQPGENSAEQHNRSDTPDSTVTMLRFIKKTRSRSRRGSESSGDGSDNQSSDVESILVKSPAHPPVLPELHFGNPSEQGEEALGLARMHSIARRYGGHEWQMNETQSLRNDNGNTVAGIRSRNDTLNDENGQVLVRETTDLSAHEQKSTNGVATSHNQSKIITSAKSVELLRGPHHGASVKQTHPLSPLRLAGAIRTPDGKAKTSSISTNSASPSHQAQAPSSPYVGGSSNSMVSPRKQLYEDEGSYLTATTTSSSHHSMGDSVITTDSGDSLTNEYYPLGSPTHVVSNANYPYHAVSPGARPRLWKDIPVFDKYQGTLVEQDARAKAAKEEAARMYRERREKKLAAKAERKEAKKLQKLEEDEMKKKQQQQRKVQNDDHNEDVSPVRQPLIATLPLLVVREDDDGDVVGNPPGGEETAPRKQQSLPALRNKTSARVLASM
ncbi:uncharacterized protein B0I36DRAFT_384835 [Microdochium trichocladiopsis]|uniref:Uncharacterized protein n=1 Tax=Microdochium trichocladiopsis TaxID=1682393 RepID=A0A9P8Y428_9PEZI|nr:uncharacterized protein B0I36DRAFT_384835 [Microdochium trichocladiopsis]KAH7029296.1 hypothetical protein B0I36DRAFT_384835 [Microdochium trichocladiopsis]